MFRNRVLRATAAVWLAAVGATAACADSHAGLMPDASTPSATVSPGGDEYNGTGSADRVRINSVGLFVHTPYAYATSSGINASMYYNSFHARISGTAIVMGSSGSFSTPLVAKERHTTFAFDNQQFNTTWNVPIHDVCDTRVRADVKYEVWWIYSGGWLMDTDERLASDEAQQEQCGEAPPEPGEGGGKLPGDGTVTMRCYTYTVDHYWYYPDTGTYEYRYTESKQYCEPASY